MNRKLDPAGELVHRQAMTELGLSARAHDPGAPGRIGPAIADLAGADDIAVDHVCEAIYYRRLDRQLE